MFEDKNFKEFFDQYIHTFIWADKPEDDERGYAEIMESLSADRQAILMAHAMSFFSRCWYYVEHEDPKKTFKDLGHDFFLTHQGHGAGFWDGDWPIYGDNLTDLAKCYPELDFDEFFPK